MSATQKTCTECGTEFYGRADAAYCSTACRQKAYRKRNATAKANATASRSVTDIGDVSTPVPAGDEWMSHRFSGRTGANYPTVAERVAEAERKERTQKSPAARQKALERELAEIARWDGGDVIADYVYAVGAIGLDDSDGTDYANLTAPLGEALPASIRANGAPVGMDEHRAGELADTLEAALPRLVELLALLRRRAGES